MRPQTTSLPDRRLDRCPLPEAHGPDGTRGRKGGAVSVNPQGEFELGDTAVQLEVKRRKATLSQRARVPYLLTPGCGSTQGASRGRPVTTYCRPTAKQSAAPLTSPAPACTACVFRHARSRPVRRMSKPAKSTQKLVVAGP